MKFHLLYVSSVSACFELENTSPYYAGDTFEVTVNGAPALEGVRTNVFSLFDLQPATEYCVAIGQESLTFTTKSETACLNVADFGAVGDGKTDDTAAIQSAINLCAVGGRVLVPAGTYYVRPLVLKSHMTLELKKDALLLADTCEEHYPILPGEIRDAQTGNEIQVSSWEGNPFPCRQSFISAYHAEDIAVVGQGIIDGNARPDDKVCLIFTAICLLLPVLSVLPVRKISKDIFFTLYLCVCAFSLLLFAFGMYNRK